MITNVNGAAETLGVTRQRVQQMIAEGKLLAVKEFGQWRIEGVEVERVRRILADKRKRAANEDDS